MISILAVDVYTPCNDPKVIEMTARALQLFRSRNWDGAEALFREMLVITPGDVVCELYLTDLAAVRISPPDADWAGATGLDRRKMSVPVSPLRERRERRD